jgi:starch phosphorylase
MLQWNEIKLANKIKLAKYIRDTTSIAINPHSLFDIQVKRIHEVLPLTMSTL